MKVLLEKIKLEDDYCPVCSLLEEDINESLLLEKLTVNDWIPKLTMNYVKPIPYCGDWEAMKARMREKDKETKGDDAKALIINDAINEFSTYMQTTLEKVYNYAKKKFGDDFKYEKSLDQMKRDMKLSTVSSHLQQVAGDKKQISNYHTYITDMLRLDKMPTCKELEEILTEEPEEPEKEPDFGNGSNNHITFNEAWSKATRSYNIADWYVVELNPLWEKQHTVWHANDECFCPGYVFDPKISKNEKGDVGLQIGSSGKDLEEVPFHGRAVRKLYNLVHKNAITKNFSTVKFEDMAQLGYRVGAKEEFQTWVKMSNKTILKNVSISEKEYVIREFLMSIGIFNGGELNKTGEALYEAYKTENRLWNRILTGDNFIKFIDAIHMDELKRPTNTFRKALNLPQLFASETVDSDPSKGYVEERGIIDTLKAFNNLYNSYVAGDLKDVNLDITNEENLKPYGSIAFDKNLYNRFSIKEVGVILGLDADLITNREKFIKMLSEEAKNLIVKKSNKSTDDIDKLLKEGVTTNLIRRWVFYNEDGMLYSIIDLRSMLTGAKQLEDDLSDKESSSVEEVIKKIEGLVKNNKFKPETFQDALDALLTDNKVNMDELPPDVKKGIENLKDALKSSEQTKSVGANNGTNTEKQKQ